METTFGPNMLMSWKVISSSFNAVCIWEGVKNYCFIMFVLGTSENNVCKHSSSDPPGEK